MTIRYFQPKPTTLEELKKAYRQLAKDHHPDAVGGDGESMKIINNEYDFLFPQLKNIHVNAEGETYTKENDEVADYFKDIINKIIGFKGIVIEIIGTFIWISGDTKPYKDTFKELGFKWSGKKFSWYKAPEGYIKRSRKIFSMDDIREMYGSQTVKGKENYALT